MKKYLLLAICAVMALGASAQRASSSSSTFFSSKRAEAPIRFGITAGLNIAGQTWKDDDFSYSPDSRLGFNVGLTVDFPILESLYIKSGLLYTTKGSKTEDDGDEEKLSPAYLEIPILASYRYDFSDAAQWQLNFGPYIAYGIGGKYKYGDYEEDYFGDDGAKRFDLGLQIGTGITLGQHYNIGIAYQFGLVNTVDDGDETLKNHNFMINLGYIF